MVYKMVYEVDGGCRGNGTSDAIGAAAAVQILQYGQTRSWTRVLEGYPRPTNQRAELTAILMALELARDRIDQLDANPRIHVTIKSDSRYAVNSMNVWMAKWFNNGWLNAAGRPLANLDLLQEISYLDIVLEDYGEVEYVWIPREDNQRADVLCNEAMDDINDNDSSSSDDDW